MTSCSQKNVVYFYFLSVEHPPFDEDSEITGSEGLKAKTTNDGYVSQNLRPALFQTNYLYSANKMKCQTY